MSLKTSPEEMQERPDPSSIPLNLKVKEQPSATNQEKEKRRWLREYGDMQVSSIFANALSKKE